LCDQRPGWKMLPVNTSQSTEFSGIDRREFIKTGALAAGAWAFGAPALVRGQNLNSKLNIACVGISGKGRSDTDACAGEHIAALCDVDASTVAYQTQTKKYPEARVYKDFREMLEQMGNQIDAVNVSTPDHLHAIVASAAMKRNKAVFCQKPLTQTIYEARYLRTMAHDRKLVTQMGNQGSAAHGFRRAVETIQDGLIGQVHEVHVWTNRPVWWQGMERPEGSDPVPATLDWDLWIGPAPMRPYKFSPRPGDHFGVYEPFNWRGWQDFGTGALGDMACHTVNLPFRALDLDSPTVVEAMPLGPMNRETYPVGSKIRFEFPRRKGHIPLEHPSFFHRSRTIEHDPVTVWWYDGGQPAPNARGGHDLSNKPPAAVLTDILAFRGELPDSGCLLVGEEGQVFSPDDYGSDFFIKLKGDAKFLNYSEHPALAHYPERIPRNPFFRPGIPGKVRDNDVEAHAQEWLTAIRQNKPELCYSRFDVAARLVEIMLLGCVSLRAGQKIEWNAHRMEAKNCPQAAPLIRRENRSGWVLS
jgi:Oxidoreductase family, NAD-binding Rossmann fold/Oxidoreductase family, C-terminal alpha/beta domain